VVLFKEAGVAQ